MHTRLLRWLRSNNIMDYSLLVGIIPKSALAAHKIKPNVSTGIITTIIIMMIMMMMMMVMVMVMMMIISVIVIFT